MLKWIGGAQEVRRMTIMMFGLMEFVKGSNFDFVEVRI
jgi:hypothetical protein